MNGHGRPDQDQPQVTPAAGILFLTGLIVFAITAGSLCAQIQPQPVVPQSGLQTAFPANSPASLASNGDSDFSHGFCRINISWGGGEPRVWYGEMRLSDGQMRNLALLGSEPDVPGSIWLEGTGLGVRSRSAKSFSGVHVTLDCSPEARMQLHLVDRDRKSEFATTLSVAELLKGAVQYGIDETGTRIRIERVPGDELSVGMTRGTTVFQPGESMRFDVLPRFLGFAKEKKLFLNVSLFRSRSNDRVLETEWPVIGDEIPANVTPVPVSLTLPQEEGVFDVVLTLHQKHDRSGLFGGNKDKVIVQRTFQCLVTSPVSAVDGQGVSSPGIQSDYRGTLVENIDPSNPNWWRRFAKSSIIPRIGSLGNSGTAPPAGPQYEPFPEPEEDRSTLENVRDKFSQLAPGQLLNRPQERSLWQENFGSGHVAPYQSAKYNTPGFVEMAPSFDASVTPGDASAIPISEPGKPPFLEIDYLSGVEQTLGISVVEPTVSGGLFPGTVDSGLHVSRELVSDNLSGRTLQHRVLFWPKTKTPIILLTNHSANRPAVYGGIRIYRAPDAFPRSLPAPTDPNAKPANDSRRLFATYWHRPNFCESFSATRVPGHIPHIGVTDWETFHQGINRTIQHMRMVGYGGLMVSVASDGSCLYPSRLIAPTPRYDSGVFLANGEDPVRKDVLHAMAAAFDRENMTIIPAIDFCMPLPALEEQIRRDERSNYASTFAESGLTWVGPYGNLLVNQFTDRNRTGRAPYYNLLNPNVQNAMLDVVRELVGRTASHPSFGGIAVQLSPEGYAMLPEEYWGVDDDTIARFSRETRISVPGEGPERFTVRAEFLRSHCLEQWLRWRADQVTAFYHRMAEIVAESRPDAKLYLAGAKMFDSPLCRRLFFPSLTKPGSVGRGLACHGFDAAAYRGHPHIVMMRPEKIMPDHNLADIATNLELSHTDDVVPVFRQVAGQSGMVTSLFYHQPIERTLPAFDAKSPFQPAQSWFSTEAVPADDHNRMRFIRHLADHDVAAFFDGGAALPLGEEEPIRDMAMQYQALPRVPFQQYGNDETNSTQPVTVRYANTERGTFCYLVNDASFSIPVRVLFDAGSGSRIASLSTLRDSGASRVVSGGLEWSQTLRPYDFVAFAISDAGAKPKQVEVNLPANIVGENGQVNKLLNRFESRIRLSRNWLEWDRLLNGNFEMSLAQWRQFLNEQEQLAQQTQISHAPPSTNAADKPSDARTRPLAGISRPSLGNLFSGRGVNSDTPQPGSPPVVDDVMHNRETETIIPGWRVEGDATFRAAVEARPCREGSHCLHLAAQQSGGCVTSIPFDAPQTGRLYISLWVGVSQDATGLPFRLVIRGQHQNRPFVRSATIGPAIWGTISQTPPVEGVRWHPVVVPFNDLPLTELEPLSVSLEVYGPASVWVDDLHLYHLAFTDEERTLLSRMASVADYRINKGRISDTLAVMESYWPQLLAECMPNVEELIAKQATIAAPIPQSEPAPQPATEKPAKKTIGDRFRDLKWW